MNTNNCSVVLFLSRKVLPIHTNKAEKKTKTNKLFSHLRMSISFMYSERNNQSSDERVMFFFLKSVLFSKYMKQQS